MVLCKLLSLSSAILTHMMVEFIIAAKMQHLMANMLCASLVGAPLMTMRTTGLLQTAGVQVGEKMAFSGFAVAPTSATLRKKLQLELFNYSQSFSFSPISHFCCSQAGSFFQFFPSHLKRIVLLAIKS